MRGNPRLWVDQRDATAWSNDGAHIAVAGYGIVELWSARDGHLERTLSIPGEPFQAGTISWSHDDRAVLVEEAPRTALRATAVVATSAIEAVSSLRFLHTATRGLSRFANVTLARSDRAVIELAPPISRETGDSDVLLSYDQPGELLLRTAKGCFSLGPGRATDVLTFSSDGASIFIVQRGDDGARLLSQRSTDDGRLLRAFRAEGASTVVADRAGSRAYLLVPDGVHVADLSTGAVRPMFRASEVSDALVGRVKFFNRANPDRPGGENGRVYASIKGEFLLAETKLVRQAVSIWYLNAMGRARRIVIGRWIEGIAVSPDETLFAVGSADGTVEIRERTTGKMVAEVKHAASVGALGFSPDGKLIASASDDGAVQVTVVATGSVLGAAKLDADRARLLTWSDASTVVIDTKRGQSITSRITP